MCVSSIRLLLNNKKGLFKPLFFECLRSMKQHLSCFFSWITWHCRVNVFGTNHGTRQLWPNEAVIKKLRNTGFNTVNDDGRYVNGMGQWTPIYKRPLNETVFDLLLLCFPWCCCQWCWMEIQAAHKYISSFSLSLSSLTCVCRKWFFCSQ